MPDNTAFQHLKVIVGTTITLIVITLSVDLLISGTLINGSTDNGSCALLWTVTVLDYVKSIS
jgi:hypothetical protein